MTGLLGSMLPLFIGVRYVEDLKFEYAAKLRGEIKNLERQLQEGTA